MKIKDFFTKIVSILRITSVYEVKDNYGYYQPSVISHVDMPIYKTYYWLGMKEILNPWLRNHTRSAFVMGDPILRLCRVECTKKYWKGVNNLHKQLVAPPTYKQLPPHIEHTKAESGISNAQAAVYFTGIH